MIFKAQNQVRNIYFLFDFIMGGPLSCDRLELVRKNGSFLKYGYRGGPVNRFLLVGYEFLEQQGLVSLREVWIKIHYS